MSSFPRSFDSLLAIKLILISILDLPPKKSLQCAFAFLAQ